MVWCACVDRIECDDGMGSGTCMKTLLDNFRESVEYGISNTSNYFPCFTFGFVM